MLQKKTRPWARYFARITDYALLAFLIAFSGLAIIGIFIPFIWIPIEGKLLSIWGYTPGKWIFAVRVRKQNGDKLSYKEATRRAWKVVFEGLYLAVPIISLIGMINAYILLTQNGVTEWDKEGGFIVTKNRN